MLQETKRTKQPLVKSFFLRLQWPVKVFSYFADDVIMCKKTFLLYVFTIKCKNDRFVSWSTLKIAYFQIYVRSPLTFSGNMLSGFLDIL